MRKLTVFLGLEVYAVALAILQLPGRVHTDEAKYLLNIPYPHPPLVRFFLSLFDAFSWQEIAARILFATLMVQAVWIVWMIGAALPHRHRFTLACSWLLAWAVIAEAGTIMMAPLTALQLLLFVWLFLRHDDDTHAAGWIALLWLASLFTAYQAALFVPLVVVVFWRMKIPKWQRILFIGVPIALVALYTLTNPYALSSMLHQAGKDAVETPIARVIAFLQVFLIGGSGLLAIMGTYGLLVIRRLPLLLTLLLTCAYVFLGHAFYYAILFVPLFVAGVFLLFQSRAIVPYSFVITLAVFTVAALFLQPPVNPPTAARPVLQAIRAVDPDGIVLIQGDFGHEWEYESSGLTILRYTPALQPEAHAVVCLTASCSVQKGEGFTALPGQGVTVWVH